MNKLSTAGELLRIARRNLARHKVKTILSVAAIFVSVAAYIAMDGWIAGMEIASQRNIVNCEMGAAKLQTKVYFEKLEDRPMYENFDNWEKYAAALDRAGYNAAPRFVFTGTLQSETGSAPVIFNGIDPALDDVVLHVSSAVESGRYLRPGEFAILLGNMTADKLKTGLPLRPTLFELESEILPLLPQPEHGFVRGLYAEVVKKAGMFDAKERELEPGNARYRLRQNIARADLDRYWALLEKTGRMNVRISTVIDMKAVPESVRQDKFEVDLEPLFTTAEMALFREAYVFDDLANAWLLESDDELLHGAVLSAMIRIDYSGAVRHVNQLIPAVVAGTINSPSPLLNNNTAFIPLDVLRDEAGMMTEGRVTELIIRKKNVDDSKIPGRDESAPAITAAIEAGAGILPEELGVETWEGYSQDFIKAFAGDNWTIIIFSVVLFVISFLVIANTMLLAVLERTKEIGMMRAQGMTGGQLVITMMLEAGLVGLIGAALGVFIGCMINIPMIKYGIDFSSMTETMGGDTGYRVNGIFRSAWNIPVIIITGIAAPILSSLMAFIPTRRALQMPITDSLRFD